MFIFVIALLITHFLFSSPKIFAYGHLTNFLGVNDIELGFERVLNWSILWIADSLSQVRSNELIRSLSSQRGRANDSINLMDLNLFCILSIFSTSHALSMGFQLSLWVLLTNNLNLTLGEALFLIYLFLTLLHCQSIGIFVVVSFV